MGLAAFNRMRRQQAEKRQNGVEPPAQVLEPTATGPKAEILAMAEDKNVNFLTFKAAAAKLLGDAMPSPANKAAIIEALSALPDA